jgi:hypothetical protein
MIVGRDPKGLPVEHLWTLILVETISVEVVYDFNSNFQAIAVLLNALYKI